MRLVTFTLASATLLSCGQVNIDQKDVRNFSTSEQAAMDSAMIHAEVAAVLRTKIMETFYPHTPVADEINRRNGLSGIKHNHRGVAFKVTTDSTLSRIASIAKRISTEGYSAYRSRMGFGGEPDEVCVLFALDDFDILHYEQTDGINYDITIDGLISVLQVWSQELDLTVIGASSDWVEASIGKDPKDWNELGTRIYSFCPDVVDQGTGSVSALVSEMKRTRALYLWWD